MPAFLRFLNRLMNLVTKVFFGVAGLGVATIFVMMGLGSFVHDTGGPGLRAMIHSDGFFPWPVATLFYLGGFAPALIVTGLVGAVARAVLRRLLLAKSDAALATVLSIRETGVRVNGRPRMALSLRVNRASGPSDIRIFTTIGLGAIPRTGDQVRVLISEVDPSYVAYMGLA